MPDEERNLEHKRAEYAFDCINEIAEMDEPDQKKYRTAVLSCGSLMQKSGLIQAMAYHLSKKGQREKLAEHILRWIIYYRHGGSAIDLFQVLLGADDEMLARMTSESQSIVKWLKCFAEGRLKREEDLPSEEPDEESLGKEIEVEV